MWASRSELLAWPYEFRCPLRLERQESWGDATPPAEIAVGLT